MAALRKDAIRVSSLAAFAKLREQDAAWRRRAPHIVREQSGIVHAVHFQGSQFSSSERATFTVNLAVSSPPVYEAWCGRPFPSNPAAALFPIQLRIGHLMEGMRDHWWEVTASTDLESLAASVADTIATVAGAFFSRYASSQSMLDDLRVNGSLPGLTKHQGPVLHGIMAALSGAKEEAASAFRKAIEGSPIAGFRSNVAIVASRVGVAL